MDERRTYDVVVVGGGPGGYPAAVRAAQLGLRTALVEREDLGGVCLNEGCIPTKALLHGAEVLRTVREAGRFGIRVQEPTVEVAALVQHSRQVAGQLSSGVGALLRGNGVEVLTGDATWVERGKLDVELPAEGRTVGLEAGHIILATGARPRSLPGVLPDGDRIWTAKEALRPREVPETLLVIGSGAIGAEFASLYADLGSQVTLVEALPRILPGESEEASAFMARSFARRGIEVFAGAAVEQVSAGTEQVHVTFAEASGAIAERTVSAVLIAVGVQANTEGLGLEKLQVLDERGFVRTDQHGRTGVWGLYAVGDLSGPPCLAHQATREGISCVEAFAGVSRVPQEPDWAAWVPKCTYTFPEVASIGLTAETAQLRGHEVAVGRAEMSANGRALGAGEAEGYGEVVLDAGTQEVLGAQIIGAGATETISLVATAHAAGLDGPGFARTLIPHPSRAETLHEALLAALGRPMNTL